MKFCAFDTEGRVGGSGFESVSIYSDSTRYYGQSVTEAIDILTDHALEGYTFTAHNAEYDISVLFWQHGYPVKCIYFNDRFNRGEWKAGRKGRVAQIWDTMRLSGGLSLREVGDAIGYPKYDTPQRLLGVEPDRYKWQCTQHNKWECIECYAIRDAEIVYRFIQTYERFMDNYGCKPERTISSAAVSIWRTISLPDKIYLRHEEYDTMARQSYYGGRCECFKVGKIGAVWTADVKSMYPAIMRDVPLPLPKTTNHLQTRKLDQSVLQYEGCSDCTVDVPSMYIPPLPVKHDKKLLFPIGRVRNVWTHNELRYALTLGCKIVQVHRSLYSHHSVYPFVDYVETLFALRQKYKENNDARQLTVKIMLNSLYGRLGLSKTQEQLSIEIMADGCDFRDYKGKIPTRVGNQWFIDNYRYYKSSPPYANVLWASIITAEARVRLHKYLMLQGDSIVYCDTDSVFSTAPIQGLDDGLGKLCDEDRWDNCTIIAPKIYRLEKQSGEKIVKAKGVPKRWANDFINNGECEYEQPIRPKQSLQRHIPAGTWVTMPKRMRTVPSKRIILQPENIYTLDSYSDTIPPTLELGQLNGHELISETDTSKFSTLESGIPFEEDVES